MRATLFLPLARSTATKPHLAPRLRRYVLSRPYRDAIEKPNRILSPVTTPPTFHDYLRLASADRAFLLLLFTTSGCRDTPVASPIIQSAVLSRKPQPVDGFASIHFAEVELDSPDRSNGAVADLGIEYGISGIPSMVAFGGRRAQRLTEIEEDVFLMSKEERVEEWLNRWMGKGDPHEIE